MKTFAAVMTGKGTGAISTVQLFGGSAKNIIKKIFKPTGNKPLTLQTGKIYIGTICDGGQTIDHVAVGCEGDRNFAINCHGNPLIVADIIKLLARFGVQPITAKQLLTKILSEQKHINTIELEAKLSLPDAVTIEGTKIINNQIERGLNRTASKWLDNINTVNLEEIKAQANKILQDSRIAKLIIAGCKAVIIGPPNTGKSTLLNCLAGKDKAIVTDVKGTTRDWLSAHCSVAPLLVEFIDTAGLQQELSITPKESIEKLSQQKGLQQLQEADLVLLVLDISQTIDQLDKNLLNEIAGKKVLTVLNKFDLPAVLTCDELPPALQETVAISAKFGTAIDKLKEKILRLTCTADFDPHSPVCFTPRQQNLIQQLADAKSKQQSLSIITELLNGKICV